MFQFSRDDITAVYKTLVFVKVLFRAERIQPFKICKTRVVTMIIFAVLKSLILIIKIYYHWLKCKDNHFCVAVVNGTTGSMLPSFHVNLLYLYLSIFFHWLAPFVYLFASLAS